MGDQVKRSDCLCACHSNPAIIHFVPCCVPDALAKELPQTILVLPDIGRRVETGPVRIGDDWPGVFIRGDDALSYASALDGFLNHDMGVARSVLEELIKTLRSCEMKPDVDADAG